MPVRPASPEHVAPRGGQCLNGTLYIDRKDKPWMVFCHEWLQVYDGQIAAIPLSDDLGHAIGEPIILFRASDAPWRARMAGLDRHNGNVTDGPFLHRLPDGKLIMLWSNFCREGYATGYAVSRSGEIFGPWEQQPDPLYALDGAHSMLFRTFGAGSSWRRAVPTSARASTCCSLRWTDPRHCPRTHPRETLFSQIPAEP